MKSAMLLLFSKRDPELRKYILSTINKQLVREIRVLIYNILKGQIRITDKEKKALLPYSKFMIKLSNTPIKRATNLIKREGFTILPKFENIVREVIINSNE